MESSKVIKKYDEGINAVVVVVREMSLRIDGLNETIANLNHEINDLNYEIEQLKAISGKQALQIAELEARYQKIEC